ncbi:hypothetical protein CLPUN_26210 [Clostridium puniceum]|uniref:Membrane-spanning protein n=1 Tax=Clostridium puniceum TaxID=29367 RepID=A0A1S8TG82_9CLOT|nr:hypothetical protein [Clostridium puniceum]OOM76681.1 hypothetical protein CLPUN_26210 [Clostridium puniceum]
MINKKSKLAIGITILFEIILIVTAILNTISKQWNNLLLLVQAIICIILPFIITYAANKKKLMLPSNFQPITVIFILLTLYFGEFLKFYSRFWWWDLFLHGVFGGYVVIIALYLIQGVIQKEKHVSIKRFATFSLIFAFCFSITLGTLWEIFEFLWDYFFKTNMVNGGLEDTATDLIIKIVAALITSIIYYFRKLNGSQNNLKQ